MSDKILTSELMEQIDDLIIQAHREKSHFYVANVLKDAKAEIELLTDIIKSIANNIHKWEQQR